MTCLIRSYTTRDERLEKSISLSRSKRLPLRKAAPSLSLSCNPLGPGRGTRTPIRYIRIRPKIRIYGSDSSVFPCLNCLIILCLFQLLNLLKNGEVKRRVPYFDAKSRLSTGIHYIFQLTNDPHPYYEYRSGSRRPLNRIQYGSRYETLVET